MFRKNTGWFRLLAGVVGGVGLLTSSTLRAGTAAATAEQQLRVTVDAVLKIIQDHGASRADRRTRIRTEALKRFAMTQMSGLTLGRPWAGLKPAQREEFVSVYTDILLQSYMRKIELYNGEVVEFVHTDVSGIKATVQTRLVSAKAKTPIDYRLFRAAADDWRVYDVIIDGVSLVRTYRAQYEPVLADQGFASLIRRMREKLETD